MSLTRSPDPVTATVALPPAAASVRDGRRFVMGVLETWGMDDLIETAALLTSELLTNSVLHARTDIVLTLSQREHGVEIVVRDGSRSAPRRRRRPADATTGRGLELLERLATDWDVSLDDDGKSVRFVVDAATDPWAAYTSDDWMDAEL
jgi:anti-sigma regulatory factor (Ser/Thr protein kinase)